MNYKLAYAIGFHPWEDAERHAPFLEIITGLFEREEKSKEAPYGKALDLGCGSGIWGINLAKRGWKVTSVDIVDKAIKRAKKKIEKEDVDVNLLKGDVTNLSAEGIGNNYNLILDTGTYHGLPTPQRVAMGKAVSKVASQNATLLLLVWEPKKRGPLPSGASKEEIEQNFSEWEITNIEPASKDPEGIYKILKANEQWYTLKKK